MLKWSLQVPSTDSYKGGVLQEEQLGSGVVNVLRLLIWWNFYGFQCLSEQTAYFKSKFSTHYTGMYLKIQRAKQRLTEEVRTTQTHLTTRKLLSS